MHRDASGRLVMSMSDYNVPDSPDMSRKWCPVCEPDADPSVEILNLNYCGLHLPKTTGAEDANVPTGLYMSGSSEAGGVSNMQACAIIHGKKDAAK